MPEKAKRLWHQSGVNQSGKAFVQLILNGDIIAQMDVWQARDHANAIIEAAEAAETDAFLMHWLITKVGTERGVAGQILIDFRKYREETTGKKEGATKPDDWVFPKD